jgi:hypothetical protein
VSWSAQFVADLAQSALTPMWILRTIKIGTASMASWSVRAYGGEPGIRRVRIDGHRLNDYDLTSTWGRTLIEVVGVDLGDLHEAAPRGCFMELLLGFPGYADGDYQRVAWGQLRQVRGRKPAWVIELVDAPTGLRQRPTNDPTAIELFYDLDPDDYTTLAADYTVGDATINVSSTTGFNMRTAGIGAVAVTPSSGDAFYLTYSAASANTFTLTGSDVMGTTRVNASAGDRVDRVAYLYGHPIVIALQVLTSGYGGANGFYDVHPLSWGLQVPVGYVDVWDSIYYAGSVAVVSSGTYSWSYPQRQAEGDALGWLSDFLRVGGFYLTMRQGSITVRAQQQAQAPIGVPTDWTITDDDVIEVTEHQWWSADHQEESASCTVRMSSASSSVTTAAVYQRPAAVSTTYDLSDRVFANEAAIRTEMTNRLTEAVTTTPEALTVRLRGWWWAQMAPGDLGRITTSRVHSRIDGPDGYSGRRCKIVQVSPSWETAPVTDVALLVYPSRGETWA